MLLQGKVVVVTGASRGIGKAIAMECAQQGAKLVLHHFGDAETRQEIQEMLGELRRMKHDIHGGVLDVGTVAGDISDPATSHAIIQVAVSTFQRIDVLVSNAGICPFYAFLDIPHEAYHLTRAVNLDGTFYVVQACAQQMKDQNPRGGSIIAISSISALVGGGMQAHYTPTKAGIKSLMESCAISLGPYGIRCNSLLPGTIETAINREDLADEDKRNYMQKRIPLGRLGDPVDLAGPAVFLASDMSRYVTGSSLLVDGGLFVNLQ